MSEEANKRLRKECPLCGSTLNMRGVRNNAQRYVCPKCRKWFTAGKNTDIEILKDNPERLVFNNFKEFTRMVILSDMHCGHFFGLTPEQWHLRLLTGNKIPVIGGNADDQEAIAEFQRQSWNWFCDTLDSIKPVNILVVNGDAIDGRGEHSGQTELIASDRLTQCNMAQEVIRQVDAENIYMTYGTPYHTGNMEDFENVIANNCNAHCIRPHLRLKVRDTVFSIKHYAPHSNATYGFATPLLREAVDKMLDGIYDGEQYDVIVRSHIHRGIYIDSAGMPKVIITPALQYGSKYGRKQFRTNLSYGFTVIDVFNNNVIHNKFYTVSVKPKTEQIIYA